MYEYSGAFALPGIGSDFTTFENEFWWGRWENQIHMGMVIVGSARDAGGDPTTVLRSGLLLGKITATGKLKEWNPTGTDGSEKIFGILKISQNMQVVGVNQDRYLGLIMLGGTLKPSNILIPGEATVGISGHAVEHLIRAQLFPRFIFADNFGGNVFGGYSNIAAKTADYTVLEADNNTLFTNRGALAAVNFTLPVTAKKGLRYSFYAVADFTLKVTSGTADTLVTLHDPTADSVALQTANKIIGGSFDVVGDGTGWLVIPRLWEAQTVTIVTA